MKIQIKLGDNDNRFIVLSTEHAAVAATLMATASLWERDGYHTPATYKPAESGISIQFIDDSDLEPISAKTAAAVKEAETQRASWYKEYTDRQAAEKELAETKAALIAIQAITVCVQDEPAEISETGSQSGVSESEWEEGNEPF